ncbi:MAG: N-acetyl-D-Glu racemase DgcA [Hyphomicrobium sp.]
MSTSPLSITAHCETWPLRDAFTISRGAKTEARVVVATLSDGRMTGRGEAVPYARFGETIEDALGCIAALDPQALTRERLALAMKPGAARNAVDCALWDLEAKRQGASAATLAGLPTPLRPVLTAYTISLDHPDAMAAKAEEVANLPLLKLKLGGAGDADRMRAVRAARPDARLIVDANEAWTGDILEALVAVAADLGVETIEQPLPERDDEQLRGLRRAVPICADESVRTLADLPRLIGLYDAVNIKLDKAGGLTAGLALHGAARASGLKIMVGSMVATSLAVAPAMLLAQDAEWTDLDGPLLLAKDRDPPIAIRNGVMSPADTRLWG